MANPAHLAKLNDGVREWNALRKENPSVRPDLRGADLTNAELAEADLTSADLKHTKLTHADLAKATLRDADLRWANLRSAELGSTDLASADLRNTRLANANLASADLRGAILERAILTRTDLTGARLTKANLSDSILTRAVLARANLSGARLSHARLLHADLTGTNLSDAMLTHADLTRAELRGAKLTSARLANAKLSDTILIGAKLNQTDLSDAILTRAELASADLTSAVLRGANLTHADLTNANLESASLSQTIFSEVNLQQTLGLTTAKHYGPSVVGSQTLEISQGQVPEAFLKGCGLKDWEILAARLHDPNLRPDEVIDLGYRIIEIRATSPIVPLSVFLSYTRDDQGFVERLEKRFDQDGIRSWRDVHDLVAGPLEAQIDRAIGLQRATLLVLSEKSVESDWVEWEAERARETEKKLRGKSGERQYLLCPVALDDSWKACNWPGRLRKQIEKYNILDFSRWGSNAEFEPQYQKLKTGLGIYYRK